LKNQTTEQIGEVPDKNSILPNEVVEYEPEAQFTHQIGVTGTISGPAGGMFSAGVVWDSKGGVWIYGTVGVAHGVDIFGSLSNAVYLRRG